MAWREPLVGHELPKHIAVIMDGNGRWAHQRGLPRIQGHFQGRKAAKRCVQACVDLGIKALSMYAFSAENWRRPEDEVRGILDLLEAAIREETPELHEVEVRLTASGRLHELPESLQQTIAQSREETKHHKGLTLNLLINYGGRTEIVDAAKTVARKAMAGELDLDTLEEKGFSQLMYSPELPDPDLVIRPGGEMRISNFLLWELAYSEIVLMPVLWPDFNEHHLVEAILEYSHRQRRFGGLASDDARHLVKPD
jgi:undecaprenyl diphosphate synthase